MGGRNEGVWSLEVLRHIWLRTDLIVEIEKGAAIARDRLRPDPCAIGSPRALGRSRPRDLATIEKAPLPGTPQVGDNLWSKQGAGPPGPSIEGRHLGCADSELLRGREEDAALERAALALSAGELVGTWSLLSAPGSPAGVDTSLATGGARAHRGWGEALRALPPGRRWRRRKALVGP